MRINLFAALVAVAGLSAGGAAWAFSGGKPALAADAGCCVTGDCCCPGQGSCCDQSKRASAEVAQTLTKAANCCSTGNCCCPGGGSCCATSQDQASGDAECCSAPAKAGCCSK